MCMLSGIFGECERSAHCILLVGVAAYPIAAAKPRPVRSSDATRSISTSKMCAEALFPTSAVPTYSVNPFYLSDLGVSRRTALPTNQRLAKPEQVRRDYYAANHGKDCA